MRTNHDLQQHAEPSRRLALPHDAGEGGSPKEDRVQGKGIYFPGMDSTMLTFSSLPDSRDQKGDMG